MMKNHTGGGMHMTFYTGADAEILFTGWKTTNWKEMLGSCIAVLVASILYEGLKSFREWLKGRARCNYGVMHNDRSLTPTDDVPMLFSTTPGRRVVCFYHMLQSFLHLVQFGLGYLLMLVAMTFNVWLFISVIVGAMFGYFIFNLKHAMSTNVSTEPCH